MKAKAASDKELEEMRKLLEQKERERLEALEKERLMARKYKELDIFKLDIIARELKAIDNEFSAVGKTAKMLSNDASRLKNYDEKEQIAPTERRGVAALMRQELYSAGVPEDQVRFVVRGFVNESKFKSSIIFM